MVQHSHQEVAAEAEVDGGEVMVNMIFQPQLSSATQARALCILTTYRR